MAKRRLSLRVRIPAYRAPRNEWRKQLHAAIAKRQRERGVQYEDQDRLEVQVRLYFERVSLRSHDVDNRVKDILDALQGRAGGPKGVRFLKPLVPNDSQIYRVLVEKGEPPWHGTPCDSKVRATETPVIFPPGFEPAGHEEFLLEPGRVVQVQKATPRFRAWLGQPPADTYGCARHAIVISYSTAS